MNIKSYNGFIGYVLRRTDELFQEPFVMPTAPNWPIRITYPKQPYEKHLVCNTSLIYRPAETDDRPGYIVIRAGDKETTIDILAREVHNRRATASRGDRYVQEEVFSYSSADEGRQLDALNYLCIQTEDFIDGLRAIWKRESEQATGQQLQQACRFARFIASLPIRELLDNIQTNAAIGGVEACQIDGLRKVSRRVLDIQNAIARRMDTPTLYDNRFVYYQAIDLVTYLLILVGFRYCVLSNREFLKTDRVFRFNEMLVLSLDPLNCYLNFFEPYMWSKPDLSITDSIKALRQAKIPRVSFIKPLTLGKLDYLASVIHALVSARPKDSQPIKSAIFLEYDIPKHAPALLEEVQP